MRRPSDVKAVCVPVSPRERDALIAMRVATGAGSDADLLRIALFNLARHLSDVPTDSGLFAIRHGRTKRTRWTGVLRKGIA
jgi:hypothetical protein